MDAFVSTRICNRVISLECSRMLGMHDNSGSIFALKISLFKGTIFLVKLDGSPSLTLALDRHCVHTGPRRP